MVPCPFADFCYGGTQPYQFLDQPNLLKNGIRWITWENSSSDLLQKLFFTLIFPMADTLSLAGKVALITGSGKTGGIGAAIARTFAKNGASVIIHYVSDSSKESALKISASIKADFKVKSTVVCGRVDQQERARDVVAQALADLKTPHIDILSECLTATSVESTSS